MWLPRSATFRPLALYFALVCGGYAVDISCYVILAELGTNLYVAYVTSFIVGTACNVILLRKHFAAGRHSLHKDFVMSLVSNGTLLLLMLSIYFALMNIFGIPHLAAKVLSNGLSFMLNYATRRAYF